MLGDTAEHVKANTADPSTSVTKLPIVTLVKAAGGVSSLLLFQV